MLSAMIWIHGLVGREAGRMLIDADDGAVLRLKLMRALPILKLGEELFDRGVDLGGLFGGEVVGGIGDHFEARSP